MQAQAGPALWELIVFWFVTGSGLVGLPPGERDARLVSAVSPQSIVYFEWSARGPGQTGAAGIDGFAADPEVRQFFQMLDQALTHQIEAAANDPEIQQAVRLECVQFLGRVVAHPGCLFVAYEQNPSDKPGLEGWIERLLGLRGGAIFSLGDDADAAWSSLLRILKSTPGFTGQDASPTLQIPFPVSGIPLFAHREGSHIIFAIGDSTLSRTIERLSGKSPGLDSNPRFREAINQVAVPRISSIGWIDGHGVVTTIASVLGPLGALVRPMLTVVGVDGLDRVVQSSGVDNGSMIQRTFVATGGRTNGALVLFAGAPIQPAHFRHIPADADFVAAASINLPGVYQEARQLLATLQPLSVRVFDEVMKQLEAELQLKIVDDVLPAFGDVVTVFDSPSAGGLLVTSLVVGLEIRSPEKAEAVFNRLIKLAEQSTATDQIPDEFPAIQRQQFLGHTVYCLNRSGPGFGATSSVSPTFCLTDRHLYFAIHPQAMKAQLRFLDLQRPDAKSSKHAAFDQVARQKVSIPAGDTLIYCYLDGPRAISIVSSLLPYLSPTILRQLEMEGISLDSSAIPSAAAIIPYFGDFTSVLSRRKDGLLWETRNLPPVIVSLSLLHLYHAWDSREFETLLEPVSQRRIPPGPNQVTPAAATSKPVNPDAGKDQRSTARKLAPLFLKALLPDDVQVVIPDSVMRRLEEGPSEAAKQRHEEAVQKRQAARIQREEARRKRIERRTKPNEDR